MKKYFQPDSLTWWSSVVPLVFGVLVALEAGLPSLEPVAAIINKMTGNLSPAIIINLGLVGLGITGRTGK